MTCTFTGTHVISAGKGVFDLQQLKLYNLSLVCPLTGKEHITTTDLLSVIFKLMYSKNAFNL